MEMVNLVYYFSNKVVLYPMLLVSLAIFIFGLDDLFIDICAWVMSLRPKKITFEHILKWMALPEKKIAIMVANWHESDVIGRMVAGNLSNIEYKNFVFFLGVYPNDHETLAEAKKLEEKYSRVVVVVNEKAGPTSKGQMLNQIVRYIFKKEREEGIVFDALMMHDSEDVIHPFSLHLVNYELESADFIQIPVFSFNLPWKEFIGSSYQDEFAEGHTKDLLVRERLGGGVPSAGTGTAISRSLVKELLAKQHGDFLVEGALTEDYFLGLTVDEFHRKSHFACYQLSLKPEERSLFGISNNFIATYEYFPKKIQNSIKQKTRWTIGIAFQGAQYLGWKGSLIKKYFFYRDRKGPISNLISVSSILLVIYFGGQYLLFKQFPVWMSSGWFLTFSGVNSFFMINRLIQRMICVHRVGSPINVIFSVLRYPLACVINATAGMRAWFYFRRSLKTGEVLQWSKTQHELPADFGAPIVEHVLEDV